MDRAVGEGMGMRWVARAADCERREEYAQAISKYRHAVNCLGSGPVVKEIEAKIVRLQQRQRMQTTMQPQLQQAFQGTPSSLQPSPVVSTPLPNVSWDDVAGLQAVKMQLRVAVELPRSQPQLFASARPRGISVLLYGPPGTGKVRNDISP